MREAYVAKKITDKNGLSDDLKLTKLPNELETNLVCRKDYISTISDYLKKIKLI